MNIQKLGVVALLAAVACAGAGQETKQGETTPATAGAPIAQAGQAAQQAGQAAAQAGQAAAQGAQQAGQQAVQAGKDSTSAAAGKAADAVATGTKAASETVANAADKAAQAVEPPLTPDAEFRHKKPEPLPGTPTFQAPVPVQKKLKNGARVLVVENHTLPLVSVDVTFLHGIDADPIAKSGIAEFVADTVDEGTKNRSATQFAEELENLAARLGASAGRETTSVHLNCLADTLPKALDLLADMVQNPAFKKEDVERIRTIKLARLQQKRASIGTIAFDESSKLLYGDKHPWGQPSGGTPETIGSISPEDLAQFHAAWWVPNNAVISVSGDVKTADLVKLLDAKFASWKSKPLPKLSLPALPKLDKRHIVALDKPGTTQSQVWVVGRLFPAKDPDAVAMRVANMPLGGLFSSRLNMNLREQHGYSYGVSSNVNLARTTGAISAAGGIVAKNTVDAVSEYEKELEKFSTGEITDDELVAAKQAFVRAIPSQLETNDAVSSAMGGLVSLGLPLDFYKTLPAKVMKLTSKDLGRVAKKYVKPGQWPVIVVGPVADSKQALEKLNLGPVEVRPAVAPAQAPAEKPAAAAPAPAAKPAAAAPAQAPAAKPAAAAPAGSK